MAIQKENEKAQAIADAAKTVAKADGDRDAAIATAQGEAESIRIKAEANAKANQLLSGSITPALIELKRLEAWDGHLPQINGGSTNPFVSIETKK